MVSAGRAVLVDGVAAVTAAGAQSRSGDDEAIEIFAVRTIEVACVR